jgi:hypothetical protein
MRGMSILSPGMCAAGLALCAAALLCAGCASNPPSSGGAPPVTPPALTTYYLNCLAATDGSGSQASPWNSPNDVNSHIFKAGNSLLINRGTTCNGSLQLLGSGASGSPVIIDAYGTGSAPVINGGASNQALLLNSQSYWEINNLEIVGGVNYGVYVTGGIAATPINHIYLKNLNVHGATATSVTRGDSGEIVMNANGIGETLNDILVDSVTAGSSQVSEGIVIIAGGGWVGDSSQPLGNNITVQNSTAHDVYGDGIVILETTNGTVQNSVVYNTGLCPNCTGSTPSGLWEWWCHTCTIQFNESYSNHSWADYDGGDFDIDYYNTNNIVQYNYGHDSDGYCIAFFGAENTVDTNNIFRYNVCSNNERNPASVSQGDVNLGTWDGGSLSGAQIYNNTFYWNPAAPAPLLNAQGAAYTDGLSNFFTNNIIYSTVPEMISANSNFSLDNNIYWEVGGGAPQWLWNGQTYTSLASYQAATSQDGQSQNADPLLVNPTSDATGRPTTAFSLKDGSPALGAGVNVCAGISGCTMGTQDFFGNPLPTGGNGLNIGAFQ